MMRLMTSHHTLSLFDSAELSGISNRPLVFLDLVIVRLIVPVSSNALDFLPCQGWASNADAQERAAIPFSSRLIYSMTSIVIIMSFLIRLSPGVWASGHMPKCY
jgi:hypothetical protein